MVREANGNDKSHGDFDEVFPRTDEDSDKLAEALAEFSEVITEPTDLKSDKVHQFIESHKHLENFEGLAFECLRLEEECRQRGQSDAVRDTSSSFGSPTGARVDQANYSSRRSRVLWLSAVASLMSSSVLFAVAVAVILQRNSATAVGLAESRALAYHSELLIARAERDAQARSLRTSAFREDALERELREAKNLSVSLKEEKVRLSKECSTVAVALNAARTELNDLEKLRISAADGRAACERERDALRRRLAESDAALERLRSESANERSELVRLRENESRWRMTARRNGGPGPLVLATHALGMVSDSTNLTLLARSVPDPDLKKRFQDLTTKSIDTSESLLSDAAEIIGSEGGAEEMRLRYVALQRAVVDYNKELKGLRQSLSEVRPVEAADRSAAVALITYGFKNRLHAIQIHRASGWIKPVYGESHVTSKIVQLARSLDESGKAVAEYVRGRPSDANVSAVQSKSDIIIDAFKRLTGDKGSSSPSSDVKATTP